MCKFAVTSYEDDKLEGEQALDSARIDQRLRRCSGVGMRGLIFGNKLACNSDTRASANYIRKFGSEVSGGLSSISKR